MAKLDVKLIQSVEAGRVILQERAAARLEARPGNRSKTPTLEIDRGQNYQQWLGFGGALTEASASVLQQLSLEQQQTILRDYFDAEQGLGYTMLRTHMNSCDFALGNYSCAEYPDDASLQNFQIDRDKQYLLPFIKQAAALSAEALQVLVSPWSPPAWMKTNQQMNHGGKLKAEWRATWALHYCKFIQAYQQEGVTVWGITPQNEPEALQIWDSCLYTGAEERDFIRDYLGPALRDNGLAEVKIIAYDHNRDHLFERAQLIFDDPEARSFVWGMGYHWYVSKEFGNLSRTHEAYPDCHIIFTEGCIEGGVKLGQWDRGEIYAEHMINDINSWCEAWIDWNMVLDQDGGPNHVGNLCDAPVIVNTHSKEVFYQTSFHYLAHFSRYIRPGSRRIGLASQGVDGLLATAFASQDGSRLTVVVLNRSEQSHNFDLVVKELGFIATESPAHSISTYSIDC